MVAWRIEAADAFYDSLAALDDTAETAKVVEALVHRATSRPASAPELRGLKVRAVRSRSWGAYPALRLFYTFDGEAVRLLSVEPWDELNP